MAGTGSWSDTRRSFPPRTARAILARDGVCQLNLPGCTGAADEADHIVSHAEATRQGWEQRDIDDMSNGRAVCKPCHQIITRAQQRAGQQRRRAASQRPAPQHPGLTA